MTTDKPLVINDILSLITFFIKLLLLFLKLPFKDFASTLKLIKLLIPNLTPKKTKNSLLIYTYK